MTNIDSIIEKKGKLVGREEEFDYVFENHDSTYYIKSKLKNGNSFSSVTNSVYVYLDKERYRNELSIYTLNREKLLQVYNNLSKNQIKYSYYNDDHIKGTINIDKDQLIFTSIPYDTNWDIYLDGKKVKPIKLLDSLIGIEAKEGKHKLEMKYSNKNLIIPLIISIFSLIYVIKKDFSKE